MRCGIDGRIPGTANCEARMSETGELLVLCAQCYHTMAMHGPIQGHMPYPSFPSAAAVNTTFMVGRPLGSAVGTVMGNVAALGVGATMGVASSVSQVASHALRRNPSVMLPNFAFQPAIKECLMSKDFFTRQRRLLHQQKCQMVGVSLQRVPDKPQNPLLVDVQSVNPQLVQVKVPAPTEETLEPKEEPTSDEAQREGLQEPEAYDFDISEECQGVIGENPELKKLVTELLKSVRDVAGERNQKRKELEEVQRTAREMERYALRLQQQHHDMRQSAQTPRGSSTKQAVTPGMSE